MPELCHYLVRSACDHALLMATNALVPVAPASCKVQLSWPKTFLREQSFRMVFNFLNAHSRRTSCSDLLKRD